MVILSCSMYIVTIVLNAKKKETPFEETLRDNANYDYNDLTRKCSLRKCLEVAEELYDHQHEQELDAVCV